MHNRLDNSFAKHNKTVSLIHENNELNMKKKEEIKFRQFSDFYFFFEKQKKLKKESSLKRIQKLENNQRLKDERLKEFKVKNSETMKRIAQIEKNKNDAKNQLNEVLMKKKEIHLNKLNNVFAKKKHLDIEREEINKEVLSKQVDFILHKQRMERNNALHTQHIK